jgi:hypothetical protein
VAAVPRSIEITAERRFLPLAAKIAATFDMIASNTRLQAGK